MGRSRSERGFSRHIGRLPSTCLGGFAASEAFVAVCQSDPRTAYVVVARR